MKHLKLIIIFLCIAVCVIIFCKNTFVKYEGLLKTNEDVILNLCNRYPGDDFEVLKKDKIQVYTEDYRGKTIKKNGYSYKVKSKKTNVEFEVSDDIYYGCSGHIADRAIFYIKDTYKESWYMQIANIPIYEITSIDDLKNYEYLKKYINN